MDASLSAQQPLAEQHVIKGRQIVARQRELIERIRARDGDCDKAEGLLSQFEATLAIFEQDLAASANQKRG